ncbi:MAG TPA: hypothetical protein VGS03_10690, partial [Candidatus Polarisedimenticolia bacterium]|nr:hypothetical protein [Candidatus Polarisedimenticolia bacterium]
MSRTSEPHCRTGFRNLWRTPVIQAFAAMGTLAAVLGAFMVSQPGVASAPARIQIEHAGHVAGEPITITGSGFGLNENVTLTVRHDDGAAEPDMGHQSWTVLAADGTFSTTWTIRPGDAGSDFFAVTAVGGISGAGDTGRFGRMAFIVTDKFDYAPGDTALITGAGFRAGETVTLQVSHTNHVSEAGAGHDPWTVTADPSGRISATWYVDSDDSLGASFILKARGEDSQLRARWAFIDAVCPPAPAPDAVVPYPMPGQACPTNLNSCTANDVVTTVVAATPLNGDVCGSADDTLTLDFTVQFATTANQRYDLGFYIAKDGNSIPGHTAQVCAGAAPQVGEGDGNSDASDCDSDLFLDLDHDGHLPDRNAVDTCGDLENNAGPVRMTFRATVACDHLDANHNLLVPSCRVWEQNANHQVACTSLSQAGTGSKCDCTDLSFAGHLDPCVTAYCDDGNACTADSCTDEGGVAVCHHDNVADQTTCDDGSACTTGDVCISGHCTGGAPPNCDDGNVCTTDACDPATGCTHVNNNGPCDDGDWCNGDDTCSGGSCSDHHGRCAPGQICDGGSHTCHECDHDGDCHDPGSPYCDTGSHTCKQCLNDGQCDDHDACNGSETCVANHCTPGTTPDCDDHNVCTTDSCDAAVGCKHDNNTASCDDGVFCNGSDVCQNGECTHRNDECQPGQI